ASVREHGWPTIKSSFWPEGANQRINPAEWPGKRNGKGFPSVVVGAIRARFGIDAGEQYLARSELEWRLDMLAVEGRRSTADKLAIAAEQIIHAYLLEIRQQTTLEVERMVRAEHAKIAETVDDGERELLHRVIERRQRALKQWKEQDMPLDQGGWSKVSAMLGSAQMPPIFPASTRDAQVKSDTIVTNMIEMALDTTKMGAPLFSSRSLLTVSLIQATLAVFTNGLSEENSVLHRQWLSTAMIKEFEISDIKTIPWKTKASRFAKAKAWTSLLHSSTGKKTTATGKYMPQNEEEVVALHEAEEFQRTNPTPHTWSALEPMDIPSTPIMRGDISKEMDNGFTLLETDQGATKYTKGYDYLRKLFEEHITEDLPQYILFCATVICKTHPAYCCLAANSKRIRTLQEAEQVIANMTLCTTPKNRKGNDRKGITHRGQIAASFIAWLTYKYYADKGMMSRLWGVEEEKLKAKVVMNKGFPEISPSGVKYWSMTPPEKVAEHWSTIKSHWERKMYKSAMRLICSADTLEMWEKNGLLDKPR
ncbi:hypothetical protein CALCODRAFT_540512, partial [Calocera cornea HHB12733]